MGIFLYKYISNFKIRQDIQELINVLYNKNEYIAPPEYYMLFVINDKTKSNSGEVRIPSVAKKIRLKRIKKFHFR